MELARKRPRPAAEVSTDTNNNLNQMSLYEQQRQTRIQENARLLVDLQLVDVLKVPTPTVLKLKTTAKKNKSKKKLLSLPRRSSVRLASKSLLSSPSLYVESSFDEQTCSSDESESKLADNLAQLMDLDELNDFHSSLLSTSIPPPLIPPSSRSVVEEVHRLQCASDLVAKVVPNRICSVVWHSSADKLLGFVADKKGYVGMWDILHRSDNCFNGKVFDWHMHNGAVYGMSLSPELCNQLWTGGYDGRVRCLDLVTGTFKLVHEEKDVRVNSLAASTAGHEILVGNGAGQLLMLDPRCSSVVHRWNCTSRVIKCISVRPSPYNNFVLTSSSAGEVDLWDLRLLGRCSDGKKPLFLAEFPSSRSTESAYFSPLTGKQVLTCSADNELRVYDMEHADFASSCATRMVAKHTIPHNNRTGRWLTPFRAVWHSQREDLFFVGSMCSPRRIEAYGSDRGDLIATLGDESVTSVASLLSVHPTLPALLGANSSGRCCAFIDASLRDERVYP